MVRATVNLQVRLPEELRQRLADAAETSKRSMNSEVVWRLGQSFGDQGLFAQHEATETEHKKVIDEILKSPEFRRQFVERLSESPVLIEAVKNQGKKKKGK
jgi:hypothetical protein